MGRKPKDEAGPPETAKVAATVMLSLGRTKATHEFEEISVSTDDPSHVTVLLSSTDGRTISVMLPRADARLRDRPLRLRPRLPEDGRDEPAVANRWSRKAACAKP